MQDTLFCPFCGKKLANTKLHSIQDIVLVERYCLTDFNHTFRLLLNKKTQQVFHSSISWNNSRSLVIDFIKKLTQVSYWKDNKPYIVTVERILIPDFPDLKSLNEKLDLIILYS